MVVREQQAPNTQLAGLIASKMGEQGVSIKDMAARLEITYEHVRRVVRGEGIPSKYVLKAFCEMLGIPFREAEKIATGDRIRKKYGKVTLEMAGRIPTLEPIENMWPTLTEPQHMALIDLAKSFSRSNKTLKLS